MNGSSLIGSDERAAARRILAIFLPRMLSEVVESGTLSLVEEKSHARSHPGSRSRSEEQSNAHRTLGPTAAPRGIILIDDDARLDASGPGEASSCWNTNSGIVSNGDVRSSDVLNDVCLRAARAGVRPGQTVTEARALVAHLTIATVSKQRVLAELIAVAEVAKSFGTCVSWEFFDTVWVDVTGVAHLFGGEEELCRAVQERVRSLGHVARVCLANGPHIARAIARYGGPSCVTVPPERAKEAIGRVPLLALPLSAEKVAWLTRVGLFTVADLAALPPEAASARLGDDALKILALAGGHDPEPLTLGNFPRIMREDIEWDEPVPGEQPLLFALRGLVAKLSARLRGRGEACSSLVLTLAHDRAISQNEGVSRQTVLEFELSAPLSAEGDLERALRGRIERLTLRAPTIGMSLRAEKLGPELLDQMSLAEAEGTGLKNDSASLWSTTIEASEQRKREFAVLLQELEADVGRAGVGVLTLVDSFLPESASELRPLSALTMKSTATSRRKNRAPHVAGRPSKATASKRPKSARESAPQRQLSFGARPRPLLQNWTRTFLHPVKINAHLAQGESFGLGRHLYTIGRLRFLERLDAVQWWTPRAASRDYFWAWLDSPHGGTEALLFVDRYSGERFVQALGE